MGRLDGFDYYHEDSDDEGSESEDESQFTSPNHTDPCKKYPVYVYLLMTEYKCEQLHFKILDVRTNTC